jgi:hypothetical protein
LTNLALYNTNLVRGWIRGCRSALTGPVSILQPPQVLSSNSLANIATDVVRKFWRTFQQSPQLSRRSNKYYRTLNTTISGQGSSKPLALRPRAQSLCGLNANAGAFANLRLAAHQLFVNNVLRRVTNSQTRGLRKRTVQQLFGGNAAPFLALVGVSLASGTGTCQPVLLIYLFHTTCKSMQELLF